MTFYSAFGVKMSRFCHIYITLLLVLFYNTTKYLIHLCDLEFIISDIITLPDAMSYAKAI